MQDKQDEEFYNDAIEVIKLNGAKVAVGMKCNGVK